MTKFGKAAVAAGSTALIAALGGTVTAVASSDAPATNHSGTVHVWVMQHSGAVQRIVFTGVIGDYGKATSIDKDGKVNPNGSYVKIALKHGGFEVNAVAFGKKASSTPLKTDKATCSAWSTVSAPVKLFNGTGAYAGITGKVRISTSFAIIGPRFHSGPKKGKCNMSNSAKPVAVFNGQITGSGHVTY